MNIYCRSQQGGGRYAPSRTEYEARIMNGKLKRGPLQCLQGRILIFQFLILTFGGKTLKDYPKILKNEALKINNSALLCKIPKMLSKWLLKKLMVS